MAELIASGAVRKMKTQLADPVSYTMLLGDSEIPVNRYLGQSLRLDYSGVINCIYCDRKTSKSFNQGYCYPCFKRLARCPSRFISNTSPSLESLCQYHHSSLPKPLHHPNYHTANYHPNSPPNTPHQHVSL